MSEEIFFTPDPIKDPSNRYRNGLVLVVILVGTVSMFIWQVGSRFGDVFNWEEVSEKVSPNTQVVAREGGDITIEPIVETPVSPKLPVLIGELPPADDFTAKSVIVKDEQSGLVLFSKDEYEPQSIASVTKLMSALVIIDEKPNWSATTTVCGDDVPDTHMYKGDTYTLSELWQAGLVGSSNKAILTLVDALGFSRDDFVQNMNEKARELGMVDSVFSDPTGLEINNMSSASDTAMLLSAALSTVSIEEALKMEEMNLYSAERKKSHHIWSTNWLMLDWVTNEFDSVIGKTGYIPEAGYNFVSRVTNDEGKNLLIVILGAATHEDRFTETKKAAEWAFQAYEWPEE